ncbi:hypothetical protein HAP48_0011100 [Bradyrhizobium septentrionale]|uniref:Peptidase metallopeptidase domain-containing protein n=1 Tax=Bradyrhizobium septentrionale TaxID=1404411 RepID=A0A974A615_9BRAD|nr:hypothetical protein [Bradyrhizobium septentrionale]UGY17922.1 hypothetical protein HAP48_0011100 [Bradyrhizobium septentrionale]
MFRITALALTFFAMLSGACVAQSQDEYKAVLADPDNDGVFEAFLKKLPTISTTEDGAARTYYLLEGDLLMSREQVKSTIQFQARGFQPATKPTGELLVMTKNGVPTFWAKGKRELTYAVARQSFSSPEEYKTVVEHMKKAAADWEGVCPECGLSIKYKEEFDGNPQLDKVLFIVRYVPGEKRFIAASFFPADPESKRYLNVGPQFYTTIFDRTGVLRHELGHVIGYRHEQIRGVPGCYLEDNNFKPLTEYDPKSVMHYFCGGGGTMNLVISESDQRGHRDLYR